MADDPEYVVLLDDAGAPTGTAERSLVHHRSTPLHLAFSCYIFDDRGRLLVTRRALSKQAFAGVWSNSCCGHPAPGEDVAEAVRRRASQELGMTLTDVTCILPDFRYRAVDADGTLENEICPVFTATGSADPRPSPDEVADWRWVPWQAFADLVATNPWAISPWAAEQTPLLVRRIHPDRRRPSTPPARRSR